MTRTKEQIEAELSRLKDEIAEADAKKAALQAELAKLDADPLLIEAREISDAYYSGDKYRGDIIPTARELALAALRRGMELAAAPLMPATASNSVATLTEAEIKELADKCLQECQPWANLNQVITHAIRATIARLGHGRKAWPSEAGNLLYRCQQLLERNIETKTRCDSDEQHLVVDIRDRLREFGA